MKSSHDFRIKNFKILPYIVLACCSFIIISPQIFDKFIVLGHDFIFHFNRFYDISKQIETGKFNYFQSVYGFNSSGRIINALYGYDFAVVQALILLVTKSWLKFQIISSFLCLYVAGISMYLLSKKLNISTKFSIMAGCVYMSSVPVSYYVRHQSFTGWGSAFLPLIFIPALRALNKKDRAINPVFLAIPVSILINVHILSAAIGILAILPFFLVSFIKSNDKFSWIKDGALAVILAILLSLNTLLSYFDVFSSNNILSPFLPSSMLQETMRLSLSNVSLQKDAGILFSGIFIFQLLYSIINWKQFDVNKKVINFTGVLFLIVSSPYLPWNLIQRKLDFISIIQFPSRFSVIAYILLTVGFFLSIETILESSNDKVKKISIAVVGTLVFLTVNSVYLLMIDDAKKWVESPILMGDNKSGLIVDTPEEIRRNIRSNDMTKVFDTIAKGTPDYLPIAENVTSQEVYENSKPYTLYKKEIVHNKLEVEKAVLDDGRLSLTWNNDKDETIKTLLPVTIYGHSTVIFNGENQTVDKLEVSPIGSLKVRATPGLNNVVIGYQPHFNIKVIIIIKLATILGVLVYLFFKVGLKKSK